MDYEFAADYGLASTMPVDQNYNYFTPLQPMNYSSNFSLNSPTISPELPSYTVGSGQSATVTEMVNPSPAPTGNTFGDLLSGVSATAKTFLDTAGKVYSLKNQWESQKFGQEVQSAQLDLQRAQLGAQVDISKDKSATQRDLAVLESQAQVADAQAQVRSSQGASVLTQNAAIPWGLLGIAAAVGLFVMSRRGK